MLWGRQVRGHRQATACVGGGRDSRPTQNLPFTHGTHEMNKPIPSGRLQHGVWTRKLLRSPCRENYGHQCHTGQERSISINGWHESCTVQFCLLGDASFKCRMDDVQDSAAYTCATHVRDIGAPMSRARSSLRPFRPLQGRRKAEASRPPLTCAFIPAIAYKAWSRAGGTITQKICEAFEANPHAFSSDSILHKEQPQKVQCRHRKSCKLLL
jgi:hypothetical protein